MDLVKRCLKKYNNFETKTTSKISDFYKKNKYLIKPFLILMVIYTIAYYPIFRANFNYLDDWNRVFTGIRSWENFSRYISNFLSIFIHTSSTLTDVSPLTQFIAIIFLSFSGVILLHLFKKDKISITSIIACLLIGLNPYFLNCMFYKFDSPYMALSILASVFPFLFFNKNKKYNVLFGMINFIGTLIMCMTYQAASGIIPMVALFLAYKYWNEKDNKNAIKILIVSAFSYLLGLLFFKIFIMIPVDDYVSNTLLPFNKIIFGFIENLKTYYWYVKSDFRFIWLLLFIIITIFFIIKQIIQSKQNKIYAIFITFIFLIGLFSLAFGLYPTLEQPLFEPRAMYGFGFLMALVSLNTINIKNSYVTKIFVLGLCYCFFAFSFTCGNALSEQNRYVNFRIESLLNGLNEIDIMRNNEKKTIKFINNIGQSPVIENMRYDYKKLMNRLINKKDTGFGNGGWANYKLKYYNKNDNIIVNNSIDVPRDKFKVEKDTMYYKIESNGKDFIIITLK